MTEDDIGNVVNIYSGRKIIACKRYNNGVDNEVFLITLETGKKLVLKSYSKQNIPKIQNIIDNTKEIVNNEIKTPNIVSGPIRYKHFVCQFFEHIEGDNLDKIATDDLKAIAGIMYKFSKISSERIKFSAEKELSLKELMSRCKDWEEVRMISRTIQKHIGVIDKATRKGTLHGDFSKSNIIKTKEGEYYLLDMDHVRHGETIDDLSRSLIFFGFSNRIFDSTKASILIDAYFEKTKEKRHSVDVIISRMIVLLAHMTLSTFYYTEVIREVEAERVGRSEMNQTSESYSIATLLTTRNRRGDDIEEEVKSIRQEDYMSLAKNDLVVDMRDEANSVCYGYTRKSLNANKINILFGSPYASKQFRDLKGSVLVLLEGEASQGLELRETQGVLRVQRELLNRELDSRYYYNTEFRKKIDIFLWNKFDCIANLLRGFEQAIANFNALT